MIRLTSNIKKRENPLFFYEYSNISTYSCTFDEFKSDVANLFLEDICKEFVTKYEFVKVNDHKYHLVMNCTDLEKPGEVMVDQFAKV
jgi:hypothetical protein